MSNIYRISQIFQESCITEVFDDIAIVKNWISRYVLFTLLDRAYFYSAFYMHLYNSNCCSENPTIMLNIILQIYWKIDNNFHLPEWQADN